MSNLQARLIATAILTAAGAIACTSARTDPDLGLAILVVGAALFLVEYVRAQKGT